MGQTARRGKEGELMQVIGGCVDVIGLTDQKRRGQSPGLKTTMLLSLRCL